MWAVQYLPGQGDPLAGGSRQPAQKIAPSHVGKQPNARLWHTQLAALGDDAGASTLADAHAAAHHNAIHEGEIGFGVAVDQVVECVFLSEEVFQPGAAGQCGLVKKTNVATSAKAAKRAFPPHAPYGHSGNGWVVAPAQKGAGYGADHGQCQRVQGLGAVQGQ